jgi:tRNA-dihydrouridine synthase B
MRDGNAASHSGRAKALTPLQRAQQGLCRDFAHIQQPDQLAQYVVARGALERETYRSWCEEVSKMHGARSYPLAAGRVNKYFHTMQLPYPSEHSFGLILAPMAGVSEAPFRQVCRGMGADVVLSEFLSSEAIRRRIRNTLEGAEFGESERPIGIQIYGSDPNAMAEAAGLITEYYGPEFIDINFGCPVKKVVQRNGGSGCLRDLDLVDRIIRAVRGATHLPVTVKTRSGWNDELRDPVGIARRMQDSGAEAFTLHARTRTQMFSGRADWDEIARVVEALDIPVIGNGDIQSPEDVVRMRDHTGCAGVMIGRGAFGNPWLFRDAQALLAGRPKPPVPDATKRFRVALEHARLALRLQGDTRKTVIEFRKHLGWYTKGLHAASDLRQRLFQIESIAEAEAIFLEYLDPVAQVA